SPAASAELGGERGAAAAPAGRAWRRFLREPRPLALHARAQSPPPPAGSYLAACVFFAVLFGESPVGIAREVPGLSGEDLALLQQAAWLACQSAGPGGGG